MATIALAVAGLAVSAAGTAASYQGGQDAAAQSTAAANKNNQNNAAYRDELQRYQNLTWMQDIEFAQESLGYQQTEFSRQMEWTEAAGKAVTRNRDAEAFTLMARGIEETIASTFQLTGLEKQGRAARGSFAAKDRSVEGNSVEAVLGDVWRQEGEAKTIVDMNRDVTGRQLFREAMAQDAGADSQMSQIASSVRTYAPNAPIRAPGPINPVNPQSGTTAPSMGSALTSLGSAAMGAWNNYTNLAGREEAKQTVDQLSSWVGRQFTFGSPAAE